MHDIDFSKVGFSTLVIHAGAYDDKAYGAEATPIYQTSTYTFENLDEAEAVFRGEVPKYGYGRHGNPTTATLERKVAALEGAEAAAVTSSGMGAVSSVLLGELGCGDHLICADTVYGCTDKVVREYLPTFGIETTMLDTSDLEALEAAFKPNTKMVYFEACANPTLRVTDIAAVAEIAHKHGAIVVVDNTFTPPPVCRPLSLGADLVLHSMTKYINGHGDVIAGVIAGSKERVSAIVSKCVGKLTGSELAPIASYMVIRGLKTLDIRMKVHSANAMAMAEYLEKQPYIKAVYHPTLASNGKNYETAKKQFREGYCTGMITFETAEYKGLSEYEVARKRIDNLQIPGLGVALCGSDSLIQLPTAMTHAKVPAEGKKAAGITDGMVRFSVGLENIEDLIADFEQAAAKL